MKRKLNWDNIILIGSLVLLAWSFLSWLEVVSFSAFDSSHIYSRWNLIVFLFKTIPSLF